MDKETGRSRGFGFVTFENPSDCSRCLKEGPHELDGRTIEPRPAEERSEGGRGGGGGGGRDAGPSRGPINAKKCFVGGLDQHTTQRDLEEYFDQFGQVRPVWTG